MLFITIWRPLKYFLKVHDRLYIFFMFEVWSSFMLIDLYNSSSFKRPFFLKSKC